VEGVLDTPDTSASRPVLRLRITGIVVLGLFVVLGLRLWTLQVLQAPAAVQAVAANQIRTVPITPSRGFILDRSGNPLVNNVSTNEITLSRVSAQRHPGVVARLAALLSEQPAQIDAAIASTHYSPYEPVPVMIAAPLSDVLYIGGVRRCRSEGGMGLRPGSSVPALKSRGCGCPLWGTDPADGAAM
jgi:cell division protein FtsI/penicillin-binding protein 2